MIEILRHILLLACLAVVEHQPEAVALVSRTMLGAVGDVLAIGRIERRRIAGGIVGGDVLCRSPVHRNDPEIVVGGRGFDLVVVRGVANLLPVGREGVVVLPAKREHGRVVVPRREVRRYQNPAIDNYAPAAIRDANRKDMASLTFLVNIPMTVEQPLENQRLHFRLLGLFDLLYAASAFLVRIPVAFGINVRDEKNLFPIRRPEFTAGFGWDRSQLPSGAYGARR